MTKEQLRKELKKKRGQVSKKQREVWNQAIRAHLFGLSAYTDARKVMVYLSFGWEIDTWAIVENLQKQGKEVYVPVVQRQPKQLIARGYTSREDLIPAVFGILEPGPQASTVHPLELDLVIVPGLAFSAQGFRIGYGGGYYDRFLTTTNANSVGLVYHSFIRDVPADSWDQAVDFLVTEEGVLGRK